MRRLDVEKSGDLLQRREDLETVGVHARIARPEREVGVDLLESGQRVVQDRERALDDGAVAETLDVAGVDDIDALTRLGTRPVAHDALAIHGLFATK